MSYTVVRDYGEEIDRLHADIVNVARRRCRIGKVRSKAKPFAPSLPVWPHPPRDDMTFKWPNVYNDDDTPAMCRQCIGRACGNAACPMRLQVTSANNLEGWGGLG